jgi:hypothetical protein
MGLRAGLDAEARGKILCLCRGSNLDRLVVQPVVLNSLQLINSCSMEAIRTSDGQVTFEILSRITCSEGNFKKCYLCYGLKQGFPSIFQFPAPLFFYFFVIKYKLI